MSLASLTCRVRAPCSFAKGHPIAGKKKPKDDAGARWLKRPGCHPACEVSIEDPGGGKSSSTSVQPGYDSRENGLPQRNWRAGMDTLRALQERSPSWTKPMPSLAL